jgi:hypothetical protein
MSENIKVVVVDFAFAEDPTQEHYPDWEKASDQLYDCVVTAIENKTAAGSSTPVGYVMVAVHADGEITMGTNYKTDAFPSPLEGTVALIAALNNVKQNLVSCAENLAADDYNTKLSVIDLHR